MDPAVRQSLLGLLPRDEKDLEYVQYRWGFWFLAMEALLLSEEEPDEDLKGAVENARQVAQGAKKAEGFEHELRKPDYCCFRDRLEKITGLGTKAPT